MTSIRRIKPAQVTAPVTPQCEVPIKDFAPHKWCDSYVKRRQAKCDAKGYKTNFCQHPSSFVIDGKHLCTKHAGQKALKILMEQK